MARAELAHNINTRKLGLLAKKLFVTILRRLRAATAKPYQPGL
jgi:hypothetical protein